MFFVIARYYHQRILIKANLDEKKNLKAGIEPR